MNINTGLLGLVLRAASAQVSAVHFRSLQGQPRVLEVVLREQVVSHLQGSAYKQKKIIRESSCTTVLAKVS